MKYITLLLLSASPIAFGHESPAPHNHYEISTLETVISFSAVILLGLGAVKLLSKSK